MSANENCIPTNHMVLTVKDLSNFSNNVSFVGSMAKSSTSEMAKSSENNTGNVSSVAYAMVPATDFQVALCSIYYGKV